VNIFYLDVQFQDCPDETTTIVVVADTREQATNEIMEMVVNPSSVSAVITKQVFPLTAVPLVLEIREAQAHFGKFKFKGLVKG